MASTQYQIYVSDSGGLELEPKWLRTTLAHPFMFIGDRSEIIVFSYIHINGTEL